MALTNIQQVRLLVQDNTPGLYIVSDDEITFFLERNSNNINRTSLEVAKVILLNLSMRGDSQIDIMSIKGSKAAEAYRMALELFIKSPDLNPILQNTQGYFGGISINDMKANDSTLDNNIVQSPSNAQLPRSGQVLDFFIVP
jgi:hypothetical protein